MGDFSVRIEVASSRKPHQCEHCGTAINVGEPSIHCTGMWDGYFYSTYMHTDCEKAGQDYAKETGYWDEEFIWFQHVDREEFELDEWLLENHPTVAARLGVSARAAHA